MSHAINPTHVSTASPVVPAATSAQAEQTTKAAPMDPQTAARVRQFKIMVDTLSSSTDRHQNALYKHAQQITRSQQFAAAVALQHGLDQPPSDPGGVPPELSAHPDVLETLKKHRQRETQLSREVGNALDATNRGYADLLRSFSFLPPGEGREDKAAEDEKPIIDPASVDASGLVWDSYSEFHDMVAAMIGALQQNWMSKYQDAMAKFLEFYEEFSDILESLKPVGVGDKGDVEMNIKDFKEAIAKLEEKWGAKGLSVNALASFDTEQAAQAFKESLNLPGLNVEQIDGKWRVMMDVSSLADITARLEKEGDTVRWDSAKYAAWVSFKDGNVEQIKHISKVLGEKLNEMTQKFDSIVKVLSATIDKMTEVLKNYINGF